MSAHDVLEQLADGKFHSGQDLADKHGISRTAIWKQIASLEKLGLEIQRLRGKGYRIRGGLELLSESRIRAGLGPTVESLLHSLDVFHAIDSTNSELSRRPPVPHAAQVCLAESQSAGRGRRGRDWVSPFGSSIYLSTAWQFSGGVEVLEGLSLAVGVILCETLRDMGVDGLSLKWPNDVLLGGRKLAGVLIEMNGDASGPCTAIIGMGVNVRLPSNASSRIEQPWADLTQQSEELLSRNALIASLLCRLLPALSVYERGGFADWADRWRALDAYADRPVTIESAGKATAGVARGVDDRGALLLETATGLHPMHGGEVSLRPRP
ncbi:MAG: bifunctional biotin--[acetyl-CoA-carboxylase] ligase/biotin operon repressor BirA [Pseudomonadota bacterium]